MPKLFPHNTSQESTPISLAEWVVKAARLPIVETSFGNAHHNIWDTNPATLEEIIQEDVAARRAGNRAGTLVTPVAAQAETQPANAETGPANVPAMVAEPARITPAMSTGLDSAAIRDLIAAESKPTQQMQLDQIHHEETYRG